jgi:hypothetical protein
LNSGTVRVQLDVGELHGKDHLNGAKAPVFELARGFVADAHPVQLAD